MNTPPRVATATLLEGTIVVLGCPDGLEVTGFEILVAALAEQIPVCSCRCRKRVAVTVCLLVLAGTEAGGHYLIVAIRLVDDASRSIYCLVELAESETYL